MLVGPSELVGTIGGGEMEWQALAAARALLAQPAVPARTQRMVLGADLGQCCGGVVELWLERYTRADLTVLRAAGEAARRGPVLLRSRLAGSHIERELIGDAGLGSEADGMLRSRRALATPRLHCDAADQISLLERLDDDLPPLWLFGAGYVGQALARIATELPLRLTWIDSRAELFPVQTDQSIQILCSADPVASLAAAPSAACYIVLTHSHPLDYRLCRAILARGDFAWLGLIGSTSKAARFRSRLRRDGVPAERIARLVCPIGLAGIVSKWPAAIAVGVAAQLMQQISAGAGAGAGVVAREHAALASDVAPCAQGSCDSCTQR